MGYLVDTNVALWSLAAPELLSDPVTEILENPENAVYFSSISVVEFELKRERLLAEFDDLNQQLAQSLSELGFTAVPFTTADAERLAAVKPNRDPFDRMLAAQAIHRDLILLTKDRDLRQYSPVKTLW